MAGLTLPCVGLIRELCEWLSVRGSSSSLSPSRSLLFLFFFPGQATPARFCLMRPDGRTRLVPPARPHPIGRLCDATPTTSAAARLFLARRVAVTPLSCAPFVSHAGAPKSRLPFASSPPISWYGEPRPRMIRTRRSPAPVERLLGGERRAGVAAVGTRRAH